MYTKTHKLEVTGLQLELLEKALRRYRVEILLSVPFRSETEIWRTETDKVLKMFWAELHDWGKDVEEKS